MVVGLQPIITPSHHCITNTAWVTQYGILTNSSFDTHNSPRHGVLCISCAGAAQKAARLTIICCFQDVSIWAQQQQSVPHQHVQCDSRPCQSCNLQLVTSQHSPNSRQLIRHNSMWPEEADLFWPLAWWGGGSTYFPWHGLTLPPCATSFRLLCTHVATYATVHTASCASMGYPSNGQP